MAGCALQGHPEQGLIGGFAPITPPWETLSSLGYAQQDRAETQEHKVDSGFE